MYFKPILIDDIPEATKRRINGKRSAKYQKFKKQIIAFNNSSSTCAELFAYQTNYKNADTCLMSCRLILKELKIDTLKFMKRGNRIFVIKKNPSDEHLETARDGMEESKC